MKPIAIAAAFALLALSSASFAQSVSEKTGINSTLGVSPASADFVKEAAASDMMEIAISKLAQEKGNAAEKAFATKMIADHSKTSAELKGLVKSAKMSAEIPNALDS